MSSAQNNKLIDHITEVFGIKPFIKHILVRNGFETREVLAELDKQAIEVIFKRFSKKPELYEATALKYFGCRTMKDLKSELANGIHESFYLGDEKLLLNIQEYCQQLKSSGGFIDI